jgi:aryl sulfotransferase
MAVGGVRRPVEREYRNLIYDTRRWEFFAPRESDIIVCTPPKCGTTWVQMIVSTLLFPEGNAPGRLWERSPWFDARFEPIGEVVSRLEGQPFRRMIKTHTEANGIPWFPEVSYIVVGRDGRDAFMSMLNHMRNMQPALRQRLAATAIDDGIDLAAGGPPPPLEDVHEFFAWWLESPLWFDHVASYWPHRGEPNVLFVHYNDLTADLHAQTRRIATFLEIDVPDSLWPPLVDRCTFASMKQRSDEIADFEAQFVGGATTFLYKGTNGRWRDVLTSAELAAYERVCEERLTPDAIEWTKGTLINRTHARSPSS